MYRPQFAYQTPDGCRDEDFIYFFDGSNTPALANDISNTSPFQIPLQLQQDAPFFWRGVKVNAIRETTNGNPAQYEAPNITVQFQDCYQNNLSDDLVPATQYGFSIVPVALNSGFILGAPVPLEGDIYCPPGGTVYVSITAPPLGSLPVNKYFVSLALYGVKRFKRCD